MAAKASLSSKPRPDEGRTGAERKAERRIDRGAVFDELFQVAKGEQVAPGLKLIDRTRIAAQEQPRREFDDASLRELGDSIRALQERQAGIEGTGILLPLLVTPLGDGYRLIAGERRLRASQPRKDWAGVPQLPCLVLSTATVDAATISLLQLVENLQRQDLRPLEEATGIRALMNEQRLSQRDVAKLLGKSKGYVTNRLSLLTYGADVQQMVVLRKTTLMHAPLIDAVPDPALRRELIRAVVEEGASIEVLRARLESQPAPPAESPPSGLAQDHLGQKGQDKTPAHHAGTHQGTVGNSNGEPSARGDGSSRPAPRQPGADPASAGDSLSGHPLTQSLAVAATSLAEAEQQLGTMRLTCSDRQQLSQVLADLKRRLLALEARLEDGAQRTG